MLLLTPSALAAFVTFNPKGSRQSFLSTSPGCGGLFIRPLLGFLVIVLILNVRRLFALKSECNAPVAADNVQGSLSVSLRGRVTESSDGYTLFLVGVVSDRHFDFVEAGGGFLISGKVANQILRSEIIHDLIGDCG